MKLRDSLAENNSIRLQAEANTAGSRKNWCGFAGGGRRCRAALLPSDSRWRGTVRPLFRYRSGAGNAARASGRGREENRFLTGDAEKPLEFNHEDNDPVYILITMAAVDANTHREVGIMQIVNLFEDEANFDRLRACRTAQEVTDLIDRTNAAA